MYLSGSWCGTTREHERAGIVTNQIQMPLDPNRPYHSVAVCTQKACIDKGIFYVEQTTGEAAVYLADSMRAS